MSNIGFSNETAVLFVWSLALSEGMAYTLHCARDTLAICEETACHVHSMLLTTGVWVSDRLLRLDYNDMRVLPNTSDIKVKPVSQNQKLLKLSIHDVS